MLLNKHMQLRLANCKISFIISLKSKKVKVRNNFDIYTLDDYAKCYQTVFTSVKMWLTLHLKGYKVKNGGDAMPNITDIIEQYLKNILHKHPNQVIEIQRNELAEQFHCVPSQINYVISTRFTLEKGYLVESKRGGGGYIRIQRVSLPDSGLLHEHIVQTIGNNIDQAAAEGLVYQLKEAGALTERESRLIHAAVSRDVLTLKLPLRDEIRAKLLKAFLIALLAK